MSPSCLYRPSGASEAHPWGGPSGVSRSRGGSPPAVSHSPTEPSSPALASSVPSGLKATDHTRPLCPARVCWRAPVRASHSRIARSSPAVASIAPSGLKAADHSRPRFPVSVGVSVPSGPSPSRAGHADVLLDVPEAHHAIVAAGRHPGAVGAERDGTHPATVLGEGPDAPARRAVPQPYRVVVVGGREHVAMRAEGLRPQMVGLDVHLALISAGPGVPEVDPAVVARGGEPVADRAEQH